MVRDAKPEEVLPAMKAAGLDHVDHHACCICGYMTQYLLVKDNLFFDRGCDCHSVPPDPATFKEVADWINMQSDPAMKKALAKRFGIDL